MTNKAYTVVSGSFRKPDNTEVGVGGTIELPEDVAQRFRNQLTETQPGDSAKKAGTGKVGADV
ncbi:hypothetical protein [Pseudomonas neuropathica]|uniref:Uncharacterized protein n=1 Tax=Pseudomonas neuropathica TaxID=2730425 RepID=A0ACC7MPD0_9PSED